jgi:tetratricopeptide (TPR) repeat protein
VKPLQPSLLALVLLAASCASEPKQLSIHDIAEARVYADQGDYDAAEDFLSDFEVEDFDLPTQRDFNLLKARIADTDGDWGAAIRYYEAYMAQIGPADDARAAEQRLLDYGTRLLDGELRFLWIFTDRSRGVLTLENLALLGTTTSLRAEAMARVAEFHFEAQDFAEAKIFYAGLLQPQFAGLGWEDSASFRLAMCQFRLIEPDKLNGPGVLFAIDQLNAYLDGFPDGLHREEAEQHLATSRDLLSRYHLAVGDYYAKIGDPDGARHHYALGAGQVSLGDASIAALVGGTPSAAVNAARLAELPAPPTDS